MHTLARELLKSYITIDPAMEVWLRAPCDLDYHRIDETRFQPRKRAFLHHHRDSVHHRQSPADQRNGRRHRDRLHLRRALRPLSRKSGGSSSPRQRFACPVLPRFHSFRRPAGLYRCPSLPRASQFVRAHLSHHDPIDDHGWDPRIDLLLLSHHATLSPLLPTNSDRHSECPNSQRFRLPFHPPQTRSVHSSSSRLHLPLR